MNLIYVGYCGGVGSATRRYGHLNGEDEVVEVQIAEQRFVVGVELRQGRSLNQVVFIHLEDDVVLLHRKHRYRLHRKIDTN